MDHIMTMTQVLCGIAGLITQDFGNWYYVTQQIENMKEEIKYNKTLCQSK